MRNRLRNDLIAVQLLIFVDIHGTLVGYPARFIEYCLTSSQLTLDGDQRALDCGAIQIGDGSCQMWKLNAPLCILKRACKAAALVVNEDKCHLIRMIIHSQ